MKKKIKNKDLEELLNGSAQLGNCVMPGDLALTIIDARKNLKIAFDTYNESCRKISEEHCMRDAQGQLLTEHQRDTQGNPLTQAPKKLKFKDVASEAAAVEELKNLGEQEAEIEVNQVHLSALENLKNITPVQMEVLTWLVEIIK